jgi:hypothetical protein
LLIYLYLTSQGYQTPQSSAPSTQRIQDITIKPLVADGKLFDEKVAEIAGLTGVVEEVTRYTSVLFLPSGDQFEIHSHCASLTASGSNANTATESLPKTVLRNTKRCAHNQKRIARYDNCLFMQP